ncbi:MAG: hypothetical protein ABII22_05625 [Candidatus Micrarchaeota archaeon]
MFEGNSQCNLCKKELGDKDRNFNIGVSGQTYAVCNNCNTNRKEDVLRMLHQKPTRKLNND